MPKFEDKFVHFRWSDELEGKKVFYADDICYLERGVISNSNRGVVVSDGLQLQPFVVKHYDGIVREWRFVYYDPYYELKVAKEQGKTIQYLDGRDVWQDMDGCECVDGIEYRIKPDEPEKDKSITNRELAKWLSQGNGEYTEKGLRDTSINCYANFNYPSLFQDDPIPDSFLIRKWEDEEWHEPTREYLGL